MARHCVRWASGRKSKKSRRRGGKRRCQFGVARTGKRKGKCLKSRRASSRSARIRRQEKKMWESYSI